jgi:peptide subunit release factor 1 (eRF1)
LDEDQLITGYLNVNPPESNSQKDYMNKLNEAYGWAKQVSQKYYEKGRAEALQTIQKKVASSTEPPTNAAKGAYTGPDPKKMSVRDAIDLAKKRITVPRDD